MTIRRRPGAIRRRPGAIGRNPSTGPFQEGTIKVLTRKEAP